MSYCGMCGTFYNPSCPRWPSCAPAPNPHEAALVAAAASTVALAVEAAAVACGQPNFLPLMVVAEQARRIAADVDPK